MNILSVLAFSVTRDSHRGHAMAFVAPHPAAFARPTTRFELISVMVASKDAWLARKAMLACPDTHIVRSLPMHKEAKVKLEIRFPMGHGDAVIKQILDCLPNGEIGAVVASATPCQKPRVSHSNIVFLNGF